MFILLQSGFEIGFGGAGRIWRIAREDFRARCGDDD
jgi:hypothetical protein